MEDSALYERSLPFFGSLYALGRSRAGVSLRKDGLVDAVDEELHDGDLLSGFIRRLEVESDVASLCE